MVFFSFFSFFYFISICLVCVSFRSILFRPYFSCCSPFYSIFLFISLSLFHSPTESFERFYFICRAVQLTFSMRFFSYIDCCESQRWRLAMTMSLFSILSNSFFKREKLKNSVRFLSVFAASTANPTALFYRCAHIRHQLEIRARDHAHKHTQSSSLVHTLYWHAEWNRKRRRKKKRGRFLGRWSVSFSFVLRQGEAEGNNGSPTFGSFLFHNRGQVTLGCSLFLVSQIHRNILRHWLISVNFSRNGLFENGDSVLISLSNRFRLPSAVPRVMLSCRVDVAR